jgi:hypothetical protein
VTEIEAHQIENEGNKMEDNRGVGGRTPTAIVWSHVTFNDNNYSIGAITKTDGTYENFVIDEDDFERVEKRAWHIASAGYIGSDIKINGVRKVLYLHNFIMNRYEFDGKGTTKSVDHINGIPTDNRKANLDQCAL